MKKQVTASEAFNKENKEINEVILSALFCTKVAKANELLKSHPLLVKNKVVAAKNSDGYKYVEVKTKNHSIYLRHTDYSYKDLDEVLANNSDKIYVMYDGLRINTKEAKRSVFSIDYFGLLTSPNKILKQVLNKKSYSEFNNDYADYIKNKTKYESERRKSPLSQAIIDYNQYDNRYQKELEQSYRESEPSKYKDSEFLRRAADLFLRKDIDYFVPKLTSIVQNIVAKIYLVQRMIELKGKESVDISKYELNIENLFNIDSPHKVIYLDPQNPYSNVYVVIDYSEKLGDLYFAIARFVINENTKAQEKIRVTLYERTFFGTPEDLIFQSFGMLKSIIEYDPEEKMLNNMIKYIHKRTIISDKKLIGMDDQDLEGY